MDLSQQGHLRQQIYTLLNREEIKTQIVKQLITNLNQSKAINVEIYMWKW